VTAMARTAYSGREDQVIGCSGVIPAALPRSEALRLVARLSYLLTAVLFNPASRRLMGNATRRSRGDSFPIPVLILK
jgi:hypothetical protein